MARFSSYVAVYDVSDNRERLRVSKTLKNFGFRLQKSVFECVLNKRMKYELIRALTKIDIQTGFVKIYRLEYSLKNVSLGKGARRGIDEGHAFIV